jgi:ABC-type microcin C transport system permease subunit YejB
MRSNKIGVIIVGIVLGALAYLVWPWIWWAGSAMMLMVLWSKDQKGYRYDAGFRRNYTWIVGTIFIVSSIVLLLFLLSLVSDITFDPQAFGL